MATLSARPFKSVVGMLEFHTWLFQQFSRVEQPAGLVYKGNDAYSKVKCSLLGLKWRADGVNAKATLMMMVPGSFSCDSIFAAFIYVCFCLSFL